MKTKQEILKQCMVEGLTVKLPPTTLDRKLYLEVSKALELIGGKWKGGKVGGFVFQTDPTELLAEIADGENRNLKKEFQFFATPDHVADFMVENFVIRVDSESKVLEPSAGQGSLILALQRLYPDVTVDYCELMDINRKVLSKLNNVRYITDDFLQLDAVQKYDLIIANPPFSKNQDIDHIYKMYECLSIGGRIVTVASKHWEISNNKKEKAFRDWLEQVDAIIEPLDRGQFKSSGTMISSNIIVIDK
jgi:predicted RNA methylase